MTGGPGVPGGPNIRGLDKLVDELAKGRPSEKNPV